MVKQREALDVDVLYVGAGPASLASAIHLKKNLLKTNAQDETVIAIVEKSQEAGQHILSGAVMDPKAIQELLGQDWLSLGFPVEAPVAEDHVYFLTGKGWIPFLIHPPLMKNKGYFIVTLSEVVKWLAQEAEKLGINIFTGFPVSELIWDNGQVVGARIIDQMVDREGKPKDNFMPGAEIKAKIVVLGEGTRGSLTKSLVAQTKTYGKNPFVFGTGIKEIWELPKGRIKPGTVIHTAGWPLSFQQYGGAWIYGLKNNRVSIGFVSALGNHDPHFDSYKTMQTWKTHPKISAILKDGKLIKSGAKTVPEGGYYSMPKLYGNGYMIIGDAANFLNAPRLKGIHTAIKSGMLAAQAIEKALNQKQYDALSLSCYDQLFQQSWLYKELYQVRNFRQVFEGGFLLGMLRAGLQMIFGGRDIQDSISMPADYTHMCKDALDTAQTITNYDKLLTFDKATGVYLGGSMHEENQPSHLKVLDTNICSTRCKEEFQNPCEHFCPAAVYEMVNNQLVIHHTNCVHCKTCDIMDPYQIINWTVPQDSGGPQYLGM